MAAGCTIEQAQLETFASGLQQVASEWLDAATLSRTLLTDGPLPGEYFNAKTVHTLDAEVWGQAFEPPLFCDEVEVLSQRIVGERHLKLGLRLAGVMRDAIWFGRTEPLPARVRLAYRLSVDEYNGRERVQMLVQASG
jgi:single-stranded-DNA-specific exonuclease